LLASPDTPYIKLRREYEYFPGADASEFIRKLNGYAWYAQKFENAGHPWEERHSFAYFGVSDLPSIEQAVADVQAYSANKAWEIAEIIPLEASLGDCEWIHSRRSDLRRLGELLQEESVYRNFRYFLLYQQASHGWLAARQKGVLASFGPEGLELVLERKQLGHASQVLQEAIEAQESWLQWTQWRIFSKEKGFIKDLAYKNGLEWHPTALPTLLRKVENRMNLEHYLGEMRSAGWLPDVPQGLDQEALRIWFAQCLSALEAKELYEALRAEFPRFRIEDIPGPQLGKQLDRLATAVADVPARRASWERYLSAKQVQELEEGRASTDALLKSLDADFDALCEFDRLKEGLRPFEQDILHKLYELLGKWDGPLMGRVFENSVRTAWIHHIEAKYPILRAVASNRLEQLEEELKASIAAKQAVCQQMVLMHVRERIYKDVEYNRLNNMVTYREVKHQVAKKRNIWPLRKLISSHSREVLNLMPCWMASPESASAIFQMERLFDLVIFDEASQCFAERGLPAMYRGMQSVVVGDSQQLPPYELYQPRWEEETDDVALEIDSLLDLACQFLPQHLLSGHYRSEALELIEFSNRNFYENRLRMLPTRDRLLQKESALQFIKVEGIWERQRNELEADKVVEIMKSLLEQGEHSFCAIAFNFLQQELILDKMEQANIAWPPEVFVKNIENVQGDERDIVIFSIGYAPGKDGKMRFQFGSLGQHKGENRLNVAITRARRRVYVVSSIWPHQLQVEEAKHAGPKMLKDYLQFAHEASTAMFTPTVPAVGPTLANTLLRLKMQEIAPHLVQGLPFADLADLSPEMPRLFLTDDERYHQSLSVKEIYGYTPMLLSKKGWNFQRFYSRNYWKQRREFEEALRG
jgi:hypothetical protein